ncbi:DNA-binding protein [Mesorhizobium sp. L-8-10]|uniref:type II toxin-antitoxin system VapC family toxin n=1 Tax=unclassified Mesorhizobium TaxID=325217 RepID=UPI00192954F0|nr:MULTISPECIES: type II toxin-antitoxin system VapC family toxin [unclassified Mesorhizobium]BCH26668.1 DNA-binding protein [Mesorhizobium sp. L-8-3]BCH34643.1 DNA-binding protein [Mesorhizobium sp. L-8-10]
MKITADTNVLLRAFLDDHPSQSPHAQAALQGAQIVAISLPTLCEFVWVLRQGYKRSRIDILSLLRAMLETPNIVMDRPTVEAGLAIMNAGGDFADGVAAFEGRRLGGASFVTFDRQAASLLAMTGASVELLPAEA